MFISPSFQSYFFDVKLSSEWFYWENRSHQGSHRDWLSAWSFLCQVSRFPRSLSPLTRPWSPSQSLTHVIHTHSLDCGFSASNPHPPDLKVLFATSDIYSVFFCSRSWMFFTSVMRKDLSEGVEKNQDSREDRNPFHLVSKTAVSHHVTSSNAEIILCGIGNREIRTWTG